MLLLGFSIAVPTLMVTMRSEMTHPMSTMPPVSRSAHVACVAIGDAPDQSDAAVFAAFGTLQCFQRTLLTMPIRV